MNNQKNNRNNRNNGPPPDADTVEQWFDAIDDGDLKTVKAMLQQGFPVNTRDTLGDTAVIHIIETPNKAMKMKLLRLLLEAGASTKGAIHKEINAGGDYTVLKELLDFGADINEIDTESGENDTPLQFAMTLFDEASTEKSATSWYNLVLFLLDHGADPNLYHEFTDPPITQWYMQVQTPALHKKKDAYAVKLVKSMAAKGANVNARGSRGRTALMVAIAHQLPLTAAALLREGADPNLQAKNGSTALNVAVHQSNAVSTKVLLTRGADITYSILQGYPPDKIRKILRQYGVANRNYQPLPNNQNGPAERPQGVRRAYAGYGHGITVIQPNPQYRDPSVHGPAEKRGAWERRPSISQYVEETFVVPENCYVVLKGSPDALVNIKEVDHIIQQLSTLDANTLENPTTHVGAIVKKIGPVSIYGPGDVCPNVRYYFYPEFNYIKPLLEDSILRYRIKHSPRLSPSEKEAALKKLDDPVLFNLVKGIIALPFDGKDIDEKVAILDYVGDVSKATSRILVKDIVDYLFNDSVLPSTKQVHNLFKTVLGVQRYNNLTMNNITDWEMRRLSNVSPIMMTQEQLCEKLPGVYYYTVCRQYSIPEEEQESGWAYWKYTPNIQKSVNPMIQSVKSLPPHIQRVVRSLIGEAETKRKHTVKKMYNNRQAEANAKAKANQEEKKNNQTNGGTRKTHKKQKTHRV